MGIHPRRVLAALLVCGLTVVLFVVGVRFVRQATGDSPGVVGDGPLDRIVVLSSDPRVDVGLTIRIVNDLWYLTPQMFESDAEVLPDRLSVLIVVTDRWHFDFSVFGDTLAEGGVKVSTVDDVQPPWLVAETDLQLIEVPMVRDEIGYLSMVNEIPVEPGPHAQYETPNGRRLIVPELESPSIGCRVGFGDCPIRQDDFAVVDPEKGDWYGSSPSIDSNTFRVEVDSFGEWRLAGANPSPDDNDSSPSWTANNLGMPAIDMELVSSTRAQRTQRSMMWAGILFGIAGSIVATMVFGAAKMLATRPSPSAPAAAPERRLPERRPERRPSRDTDGTKILSPLVWALGAWLLWRQRRRD